jgi:hypothetical protein
VSSPFYIDPTFDSAMTKFIVTVPGEFALTANTTCAASIGSCTNNGSVFTIQPVGLGLTSFNVVLGNVVLPYISVSSSSFSL